MATTQEYLATKNVTMEVAREFIMGNYQTDLANVFTVCKNYGVNNDMIADILATDLPGLTGSIVSSFFDGNGYNGNSLGFKSTSTPIAESNPTGTLNIADILKYEDVTLHENVSLAYTQRIVNPYGDYDAYLLTSVESTIVPADYGYSTDLGAHTGFTGFGGFHQYQADNGSVMSVLNGTALGDPGTYDLITADLIS